MAIKMIVPGSTVQTYMDGRPYRTALVLWVEDEWATVKVQGERDTTRIHVDGLTAL